MLNRYGLQSETIANELEVRRRRDSEWNSIRNNFFLRYGVKPEMGGRAKPMFGFVV